MNDERDASWTDRSDRHQRHDPRRHPSIDRGRSVLRGKDPDQRADDRGQRGYYGNQGYDPRVTDAYGRGTGEYTPGYGEQDYPPGYDMAADYSGNYGNGNYGNGDYGNGYDPRTYDPRRGDPRGYDQQGYPDPGYAGYPDPGYPDSGYPDAGYPDAGYPEPVYPAQTYGQPGYASTYQPSFIERGFDEEPANDPRWRDLNGRDVGRGARIAGEEYSTDSRAHRGFADLTGANRMVNRPDAYDAAGDDFGAKRPRRRGRFVLVMTMVIVLVALAGGGVWGYGKVMAYLSTPDYTGMGTGTVAVTVADGDTATVIAATLYKAGVIKSTKAFIKAADADPNSTHIQVGTFTLHLRMSAKNALAMLLAVDSSGNPVNALVYKVSIPEGMITLDIYARLATITHLPLADFVAAAKDPIALGVDPSWFVRDDGKKTYKSIEGFLFPATYTFQPGETAKQMLTAMVTKFNQVVAPDNLNFVATAKNALRITPYEVLITASIAQVEGVDPQDMAGIARVIYNRIYKNTEAGHTLGLDSTVNYWLRLQGKDAKPSSQLTPSELNNTKDPFNTHGQAGFPIGAISNPGEAAMRGALHPDPARKDDAYFQTVGTSTKVLFAKTYAQFKAQQQ